MNQFVGHAGGVTHGVMLLTSNGLDVALTPTKLQFRAIGGVLDLYFFAGPTPMNVMSQLTSIIGRPAMPPYWSLGLMQSKCDHGSYIVLISLTKYHVNGGLMARLMPCLCHA
jgi:hypothetical protein